MNNEVSKRTVLGTVISYATFGLYDRYCEIQNEKFQAKQEAAVEVKGEIEESLAILRHEYAQLCAQSVDYSDHFYGMDEARKAKAFDFLGYLKTEEDFDIISNICNLSEQGRNRLLIGEKVKKANASGIKVYRCEAEYDRFSELDEATMGAVADISIDLEIEKQGAWASFTTLSLEDLNDICVIYKLKDIEKKKNNNLDEMEMQMSSYFHFIHEYGKYLPALTVVDLDDTEISLEEGVNADIAGQGIVGFYIDLETGERKVFLRSSGKNRHIKDNKPGVE